MTQAGVDRADPDRILDTFEDALAASAEQLAHLREPSVDSEQQMAFSTELLAWLYEGGWVRWGWPEAVGGLGGPAILRCQLYEGLAFSQRRQFGRLIGANQTPRHRLADAYVQLSAASELVHIAWASGTSWDARVAKAYAGQAVEAASRACLQVCGAMGLTSEHPLGGYVKRSRILDALHGGWHHAMRAVGDELLASRAIPQGARV